MLNFQDIAESEGDTGLDGFDLDIHFGAAIKGQIGVLNDVATLVKLHVREPDAPVFRSLMDAGFPDGLYLRPDGRAGREALSRLRSHMVEMSIDPVSLTRLSRDYLSIYMTAHHLDEAGRMTRRGDDFISCLNVLARLSGCGGGHWDCLSLTSYLEAALPTRLDPFLQWAEQKGGDSFYGCLARFTRVYCRELQSWLVTVRI